MEDITGRAIESGDLLLEIYNNGRRIFFHVAHGGFTAQYIRTIQCFSHIDDDGNDVGKLFKSQVKPKGCIIVTEEQFINSIVKKTSPTEIITEEHRAIVLKKYNSLLELSREQKAKR